jgi:hypothetical protein
MAVSPEKRMREARIRGSGPVTDTIRGWARGFKRAEDLQTLRYKAGDLVRHQSKPEWGVGRVTGQTGDGKVLIKFTGRSGDVLLAAAGADAHLVADADAVWTAPSRATSKKAAPVRRTPCVHCAAELREVVTTADGQWRSCPECSSKHRRQHVFLPFPREFDVPEAASAPVADDPKAGWCRSCRAGERSAGFRTCKEINN